MGRDHRSEGFPFETDLHTAEMRPNPEGINIRVERIPTHVEHRRQRLSEQFFQLQQIFDLRIERCEVAASDPSSDSTMTAILASPITLFNPSLPNDREVCKVSSVAAFADVRFESTDRAVALS